MQRRNIFKKKLHLSVLARLKVLILLTFVIVVGCLVAFVRSFYEFVFGWPLLHPQPYDTMSIVFMVGPWLLILYYLDKGEPEQGRISPVFWLLLVGLLLFSMVFWFIFPTRTEGMPKKRGAEYVLIDYPRTEDSDSAVSRDISKEEYELITSYHVRRNAVRWILFYGMLMLCLFYAHHNISSGNLLPSKWRYTKMNISQAILALRANTDNAKIWLELGWMLARQGEADYARDCYQRALWANLSNSPEACDLLPSWLNASPINDSTSLPSWFNEYKSGLSLFLLWRGLIVSSFTYFLLLPPISFYFVLCIMVLYPESKESLENIVQISSSAVAALLTIRWLAGVLHFLIVYLSSLFWPTTEAIMIGKLLTTRYSQRKFHLKIHFVVAYKIGKEIFYSTVPSLNAYDPAIDDSVIKSDRNLQQNKYEFGKKIPLAVNPFRPNVVLNRAEFNRDYIIAIGSIVILALLSAFLSIVVFPKELLF